MQKKHAINKSISMILIFIAATLLILLYSLADFNCYSLIAEKISVKVFLSIIIVILFISLGFVLYHFITLIHEKDRLEKKAIEERDAALSYFEIAGTILVVINRSSYVELINKKGCEVLGYDKTEIIGNKWHKFCPDQRNKKKTMKAFKRLMNGQIKSTRYFENYLQTKNGEKKLIGWNSTIIKDINGEIKGTLSSGEDITEQRLQRIELEKAKHNAESANLTMNTILNVIKENEAKLKIITSTANDAIIMMDNHGQINFFNNAANIMFGYSSDEAMEKTIFHFLDSQNIFSDFHRHFNQAMMGGTMSSPQHAIELVGKRKNGRLFPIEMSLASVCVNDNVYAVGILRDITKRKNDEEKINQQKRVLKAAFMAFPDTMLLVDSDRKIIMSNEGFTTMFGYFHNEIEGKSLKKIYRSLDDFEEKTALFTDLKDGEEQLPYVYNYRRRNKEIFPGETIVTLVKKEDGKIRGFLVVIRDISEQLKNEKKLMEAKKAAESANKSKSEFIANMSHEIRTPMNAILGFSELLSGNIKDSVNLEYVSAINYSGKMLLELINSVLDLSKIEAGKMEADYTMIKFKDVIEETTSIFKNEVKEKGLDFIVEISDDLPDFLKVDANRCRQILTNLVANAVKFTSSGYIKVKAEVLNKKGQTVDIILGVEDTGIGIPEEQLEKIFGAFEQAEGQNHAEYGGTGLGLAITKQLTEMMGGKISVSSVLGEKTCFNVQFENVEFSYDEINESLEKENICPENISFKKKKIVIADDLELNRDLLKLYIEQYGFEIIEAENGAQVMDLLEKYMPDLIFMDVKMPVLDGDAAAELIRKNDKLKNIFLIAVTAISMNGTQEKLFELFDGVVQKPFSKNEIISELIKLLPYSYIEPESDDLIIRDNQDSHELKYAENLISPEMVELLEGDFMDQWHHIKDTMTINDIEIFAKKVTGLGDQYNNKEIQSWGEKLELQVMQFDIGAVTKTMGDYSLIVERLKKGL